MELQTFTSKKTEIETDINALTKDVSTAQFKHRESEAALRKRLNKIENEVENWIAKYDNVCTFHCCCCRVKLPLLHDDDDALSIGVYLRMSHSKI